MEKSSRIRRLIIGGLLSLIIVLNTSYIIHSEISIRRLNNCVINIMNNNNDNVDITNNTIKNIYQRCRLLQEIFNNLMIIITNQTTTIKKLEKSIDGKIDNKLIQQKVTKIKLEKTLQQVNIRIVNKTIEALGSGVSLKYNGDFYILTAGHMIRELTDDIWLYENETPICKLEIVKYTEPIGADNIETTNIDLLLLKPVDKSMVPRFYVDLAENEPETSNEVYIVGNPMGIEDVMSDGRVIFYQDNYMYYIDHTYFGNSGGGVYNLEGKLIGIVSHIANLKPIEGLPDYVISGAVRLNTIVDFLKEIEKLKNNYDNEG